jgi:hypothetical protein
MERGRAVMTLRTVACATIAACAAAAMLAGPASAKVTVVDQEGAVVSAIEKAKCAVKGKKGEKWFIAFAEGSNGWELDVYIYESFWGGVKDDYSLFFGVREVGFDLYAPGGELFSNRFPFPGTPPGAGGAIKFSNDGKKLGIGFYSAPNRDYSNGVAFAGQLRCKYKPKNRP